MVATTAVATYPHTVSRPDQNREVPIGLVDHTCYAVLAFLGKRHQRGGEPCSGEPHARFDGRGLETERNRVSPDPNALARISAYGQGGNRGG